MTGSEFKAALKASGYTQADFAQIMHVHRETIGKQYQAPHVDPCWAYALAGLVAIANVTALTTLADQIEN